MEAARAVLDDLSEAEVALSARSEEPKGRVRIDAPIGIGKLLLPIFASNRKQHPKVTVELSPSDSRSEAVREGWDVVVRVGDHPAEGEMTVCKLCDARLGYYGAQGLLVALD